MSNLSTYTHNRQVPFNQLPDLPPAVSLETPLLLKKTIRAGRLLAELKGYCQTLPEPELLINTLVLQESQDSSAIENIVTTRDELYRAVAALDDETVINAATKEVLQYREALYTGWELMDKRGLTTNTMVAVMQTLKQTDTQIRKTAGTKLANPVTGEIIYTPPEGEQLIREKLAALEKFIFNDKDDTDALIKMALIHYQFEAIHPFADGNGRTGRILNVLYLMHQQLLTLPVLHLSGYIIQKKPDYYRLLREVTENQNWQEWIAFMLDAVADTAALSLKKIAAIHQLKEEMKEKVKLIMKTSYKSELIDLMFSYPYLKIKILEKKGIAHRQTASVYLRKLEQHGILHSVKSGKEIYFINHQLINLFSQLHGI